MTEESVVPLMVFCAPYLESFFLCVCVFQKKYLFDDDAFFLKGKKKKKYYSTYVFIKGHQSKVKSYITNYLVALD